MLHELRVGAALKSCESVGTLHQLSGRECIITDTYLMHHSRRYHINIVSLAKTTAG